MAVSNWQRADPKKRGPAPKPMKFPREERQNEPKTAEEQRQRKQQFLNRRKAASGN